MSGWILAAVALVIGALRVWRRRRRRSTDEPRSPVGFGPFTSAVALVAAREVRERVRGRIFRVGTALILAVVGAAIVIPVLDKGTSHPHREVGVVGGLSAPLRAIVVASGASSRTRVGFLAEADTQSARRDLQSGRVALVIVDGRSLVVKKAIAATDTSTTAQLVGAVARNLGVAEAFAAAGLSAEQATRLAGAKALPVTSVERGSASGATHSTSLLGLILVFVMLTQYNTWTLIGVMEEKSSRVVEVLLATVRPVQLLAGKVLGIGLVAFGQATLIVVFALGLAKAVGSDLLHGTAPLVLLSTLFWLVLGYAFYCWVYAAAGSMTERQDQVQSLAFPLSIPIIFGYIMSISAIASNSASTFFRVLAYLPPTAPFAMPVLVAIGAVTWWGFAASALVSIVCTVGVARLATGVYRRAILHMGRRIHLREVLHRTNNAPRRA